MQFIRKEEIMRIFIFYSHDSVESILRRRPVPNAGISDIKFSGPSAGFDLT
jgi:hypothetical protein